MDSMPPTSPRTFVVPAAAHTPTETAQIPFEGLDWLWFYPVGTRCNLECCHCLVDASPDSDVLLPLETHELEDALQQAVVAQNGRPFQIGLTGGEVFLLKSPKFGHRLFPMVEACLRHADVLILTNGLLADGSTIRRLADLARAANRTISYRVSLDGPTGAENDSIRQYRSGKPTFHLVLESLRRFVLNGVHPTVAFTYEGAGAAATVACRLQELKQAYRHLFSQYELEHLELVGIPFFDQGAEVVRREKSGIAHIESPGITNNCIVTYADRDYTRFQCSYTRAFGKEASGQTGWYKCPVLPARRIEDAAFLSSDFVQSAQAITIEHSQCITCFYAATQGSGMSCSG